MDSWLIFLLSLSGDCEGIEVFEMTLNRSSILPPTSTNIDNNKVLDIYQGSNDVGANLEISIPHPPPYE